MLDDANAVPCHAMPSEMPCPRNEVGYVHGNAHLDLACSSAAIGAVMSCVVFLAVRPRSESPMKCSNVWRQLGVGDVLAAWLGVEEAEVAVPAYCCQLSHVHFIDVGLYSPNETPFTSNTRC